MEKEESVKCVYCGKKLRGDDIVLSFSTPFGLNYYCSEECMVNYVLKFHNTSTAKEVLKLKGKIQIVTHSSR